MRQSEGERVPHWKNNNKGQERAGFVRGEKRFVQFMLLSKKVHIKNKLVIYTSL